MSSSDRTFYSEDHAYRLGPIAQEDLVKILSRYSSVLVLCDRHTHEHCLPRIVEALDERNAHIHILVPGEASKSMPTLQEVWAAMKDMGLDRKSALVALGGGVVGDLGGFAAATYMRGIPFINIPTTLLAQVDAAIGGKNGINFHGIKNILGSIRPASEILVDTNMLTTLPQDEVDTGVVEMLKHGLLHSEALFHRIAHAHREGRIIDDELIWDAAAVKMDIVSQDLHESNLRKQLNLGHTAGHALESHAHAIGRPIAHGSAVAFGMLVMARLSHLHLKLSDKATALIYTTFVPLTRYIPMQEDIDDLMKYVIHDKKNTQGALRFVLMRQIGDICIDHHMTHDELREGLRYVIDRFG